MTYSNKQNKINWISALSMIVLTFMIACNPTQGSITSTATPDKAPTVTLQTTVTGVITEPLPAIFDGQVWNWLSFQDSASGVENHDILVDDPDRYTLELLTDGNYAIRADCNSGNGYYTLFGSSLTLSMRVTTLANCSPPSLSDHFLTFLEDVVTFVIDEQGNLVLNLKMDAGNMIFAPAQSDETPLPEATAQPGSASTLLDSSDLYRGIGRISINSTCTAVLVDSGAGTSAPAYIFTNGHCVEWIANGAITNQEIEGDVLFNYFADSADSQISIPLDKIVYSSMQGIDLAIIRLKSTLGELAARKILPFSIAATALDFPGEVRVVGAPSERLDASEAYLREEMCQISGRADLLEFNWHFFDTYVTSCQDIYGGSSGSPLFSAESNTLYGLINTTVDGSSACYLGVPCEIRADGVSINQTASYATPVDGLAACFAKDGVFTLSNVCPLPPVAQLSFDEIPLSANQPPLNWDAVLGGKLPYYRYKTGAVGVVDCRSEEGYSQVIALEEQSTIMDAVPDQEGFYLLCLLAGNSPTIDDSWQNLDYPTIAIAQIDTTPPQLAPQLSIFEAPEFYDVALIFSPPELSNYIYKFGPKETTDCAVEEDYITYRRISISIEREETPIRLCVIGFDNADNPTPVLDKVFED